MDRVNAKIDWYGGMDERRTMRGICRNVNFKRRRIDRYPRTVLSSLDCKNNKNIINIYYIEWLENEREVGEREQRSGAHPSFGSGPQLKR